MKSIHLRTEVGLPQKTWKYLRFVLLLSIVFSLQQYSFALLRNHNGYFSSHTCLYDGSSISQKLPNKNTASIPVLDVEVELDEEDEIRQFDPSCSSFTNQSYLLETVFSTALRVRYQKHIGYSPSQSERPLFLLHHSWKLHLS